MPRVVQAPVPDLRVFEQLHRWKQRVSTWSALVQDHHAAGHLGYDSGRTSGDS